MLSEMDGGPLPKLVVYKELFSIVPRFTHWLK